VAIYHATRAVCVSIVWAALLLSITVSQPTGWAMTTLFCITGTVACLILRSSLVALYRLGRVKITAISPTKGTPTP
jgi:hypothetical protein